MFLFCYVLFFVSLYFNDCVDFQCCFLHITKDWGKSFKLPLSFIFTHVCIKHRFL